MGTSPLCGADHEQQTPSILIRPTMPPRVCLATASLPLPTACLNSMECSSPASHISSPFASPSTQETLDCKRKKSHRPVTPRPSGQHKASSRSVSPSSQHGASGDSSRRKLRNHSQSDRNRHSQKHHGRGAKSCTLAAFPTSEPSALQVGSLDIDVSSASKLDDLSDAVSADKFDSLSKACFEGTSSCKGEPDSHLRDHGPPGPSPRKPTRRPTPYYMHEYADSDPEVGVEAELPSMAWLKRYAANPSKRLESSALAA